MSSATPSVYPRIAYVALALGTIVLGLAAAFLEWAADVLGILDAG